MKRDYHISFTCNGENFRLPILNLVPDTEKALKNIIFAQINDIKRSLDIEEYPTINLRIKYTIDEGKTWIPYEFIER